MPRARTTLYRQFSQDSTSHVDLTPSTPAYSATLQITRFPLLASPPPRCGALGTNVCGTVMVSTNQYLYQGTESGAQANYTFFFSDGYINATADTISGGVGADNTLRIHGGTGAYRCCHGTIRTVSLNGFAVYLFPCTISGSDGTPVVSNDTLSMSVC